jgi:hypothetical protein
MSTRSWRQLVLQADPDFLKESLRPVAYRFSSGREFRQPADPYGTFLFSEEGPILQSETGELLQSESA